MNSLPSPYRESLMFAVEVSSKSCGLGWITSQGQYRRIQGPWLPSRPHLQVSGAQRVTDIKSGIKSYIEKVPVSLFAQLQRLDMLSPFPTAVAVRCPLRFCTQYKSLICQTDVSKKSFISGHWATWHIAWCPFGHHGSFTLVLNISTHRVETASLIG
jgi:hypothetical protein